MLPLALTACAGQSAMSACETACANACSVATTMGGCQRLDARTVRNYCTEHNTRCADACRSGDQAKLDVLLMRKSKCDVAHDDIIY